MPAAAQTSHQTYTEAGSAAGGVCPCVCVHSNGNIGSFTHCGVLTAVPHVPLFSQDCHRNSASTDTSEEPNMTNAELPATGVCIYALTV